MNTDNIDEAEILIDNLRIVQMAKANLISVKSEAGGDTATFTLIDKDSQIEIELPNLKDEIIEAMNDALNTKYDKIMARLREL